MCVSAAYPPQVSSCPNICLLWADRDCKMGIWDMFRQSIFRAWRVCTQQPAPTKREISLLADRNIPQFILREEELNTEIWKGSTDTFMLRRRNMKIYYYQLWRHPSTDRLSAKHSPADRLQAKHSPTDRPSAKYSLTDILQAKHSSTNRLSAKYSLTGRLSAKQQPTDRLSAKYSPTDRLQAKHPPTDRLSAKLTFPLSTLVPIEVMENESWRCKQHTYKFMLYMCLFQNTCLSLIFFWVLAPCRPVGKREQSGVHKVCSFRPEEGGTLSSLSAKCPSALKEETVFSLKCQRLPTSLHGAKIHNNVIIIIILTAVKTAYLTREHFLSPYYRDRKSSSFKGSASFSNPRSRLEQSKSVVLIHIWLIVTNG
jgi:hypothetical protein